jgi:DNA-binding NarL/FixJ family response regulator
MKIVRVLIVDDVNPVRQDLRTILTLAGAADKEHPIKIVGEAMNGLEAVRQAEILLPEVILMDLEMPVMDGFQAARQVKARCPDCRIIALTVHDYPAARQAALEAGMDGFVVKGAPVEILLEAISGS